MGARGEQSVWEAPHTRQVKAGTTRDWGKKGIQLQERENGTGSCEGGERETSAVPRHPSYLGQKLEITVLLETGEMAWYCHRD